jgi:hypothetical protein
MQRAPEHPHRRRWGALTLQRNPPPPEGTPAAIEEDDGCDTCRRGAPIGPRDLLSLSRGRCSHCDRTLPDGCGVFVVILPPAAGAS